jgi:hypothetical protein
VKCSKHSDKEAAAICERCNLLYCGSCALSSNGKCPKCGNTLRSPQAAVPDDAYQKELYKGRGQPHTFEAINALYMEPVRAFRRLKEYASLLIGVFNITIVYSIVLFIALIVVLVSFVMPVMLVAGASLDLLPFVFTFFIAVVFYYGVFIFSWIFSSLIYFLPAKLLGGKGEFVQQACLLSYMMLAALPIAALSLAISFVPVFGPFIAFVAGIIASLYFLYLTFLSIREINEFSALKTLASFVISLVIFFILSLALATLLVLIFAPPNLGNIPYPSI